MIFPFYMLQHLFFIKQHFFAPLAGDQAAAAHGLVNTQGGEK